MAIKPTLIAMSAPVTIQAGEQEGDRRGPAKFSATFYTGGALEIAGWELPVVVDLAGLNRGNVLVANLDHDRTKRVGNFDVVNDGRMLVAHGTATAKTQARDEVIGSAEEGYQWQASLEVNPRKIEEIPDGKSVTVNGQEFTGPIYVSRTGTLKGFAFVSHGADDNTTVTIAANAASNQETVTMKAEVKAWAAGMGIDTDNVTAEEAANIEANYAGFVGSKRPAKIDASNPFEVRKAEAKRIKEIREIADKFMAERDSDVDEIESIEKMVEHAILAKMTPRDFRSDMIEATYPTSHAPSRRARETEKLTDRVIEAAICQAGRLPNLESKFSDQELQLAHDKFKGRIGLKQLIVLAANANGHNTTSFDVDPSVHNAAFGLAGGRRQIHASGFSTISLSNILAATANKFLHEGWMAVDMTPMRIASIRSVSNFQQVTTVSLTGDLQYLKVGQDGEIKHGTVSDMTYTNQVDTYARMLAITRKDIINDDLGALTAIPRRLGRGAALKLNDIFWTEFLGLVGAGFFAAGNSNINTGVADMTLGGLAATETIFMNQTDPDGKPLGIMPKIILVPTALKATAVALMDPQGLMITGSDTKIPNVNVFRGRFVVESSPYISNSSYTGNTSTAWWMLADPNEMPVIEIAALNGRVEPTVETADADFNVLGVQMRGYSDVGVNEQEYRGGVHADGGAS